MFLGAARNAVFPFRVFSAGVVVFIGKSNKNAMLCFEAAEYEHKSEQRGGFPT